jgi:hypothetical protein
MQIADKALTQTKATPNSDHGFAKTDKELNLNAALRQAGLIQLNPDGFGEVMARFGLAGRRFGGDHVEGTRGR